VELNRRDTNAHCLLHFLGDSLMAGYQNRRRAIGIRHQATGEFIQIPIANCIQEPVDQ
jgi:hypothetical protein